MSDHPALTTGARLRSQVCTTEVIVVRPPALDLALTCGGRPMIPLTSGERSTEDAPEPGFDTGTLLGKRYAAPGDDNFEVLVTKAGAGTLADGEVPLAFKMAKALPSSD